jgi:hypothetical protein
MPSASYDLITTAHTWMLWTSMHERVMMATDGQPGSQPSEGDERCCELSLLIIAPHKHGTPNTRPYQVSESCDHGLSYLTINQTAIASTFIRCVNTRAAQEDAQTIHSPAL